MMFQNGQWAPNFPGQQPWQDPEFMDFVRRQNLLGNSQSQQQGGQQNMTPPTIHADIIQIGALNEMDQYGIAPGASQMFMTRDEQTIAIRSAFANNQHNDDIYDKRPPAPPAPTLNPADYVRKDELQALIAEALQARTAPTKAKKEEAA